MLSLMQVPELRVQRSRVTLPADAPNVRKHNAVFLNIPTLADAPLVVNSRLVYHNSKYMVTWMDLQYRATINNSTAVLYFREEREAYYSGLRRSMPFIQPAQTFNSIAERNVFVPLAPENSVFEQRGLRIHSFAKRAHAYATYISQSMNNPQWEAYHTKTMIFHLDHWLSSTSLNLPTSLMRQPTLNPIYFFTFMLKHQSATLQELFKGINLVFLTEKTFLYLKGENIDQGTLRTLSREFRRMNLDLEPVITETDAQLSQSDNVTEDEMAAIQTVLNQKYNFTGDEVADAIETGAKEGENPMDNDNPEVVEKVLKAAQRERIGDVRPLSKRDEELRDKQKQLQVRGKTIGDILNVGNMDAGLESFTVKDKIKSTNENVHTVTYPSFEKVYNEKLMQKDMMSVIQSLNDTRLPVFVRDIKKEDSSDELNFKSTYTIQYEDVNRVRHNVKVDMPEFIDDKFLYLNGNKKMIVKQLFMKPIVKVGPNEVQICSNYNKIFMRRHGAKLSSKVEKFRKTLATNPAGVTVKYGKVGYGNRGSRTTIEYDEIAANVMEIKANGMDLLFTQSAVNERLSKLNKKTPEGYMCIGFKRQEPIFVNLATQQTDAKEDIVDLFVTHAKLDGVFKEQSTGKKFMYTRATIMSKQVPIALLLSYLLGISGLLRRANIQHYFSDTRPRVDLSQGVIAFADGFLVYEKYPMENSLLLNAFEDIETKAFDYEEFDSKDVYYTLFETMFGRRNIASAFDNFNDFMIDPITKGVLEDLNLPTNFVDVILYANNLLVDNAFTPENDMSLYRVRSNELVNAYLYKALSDAFQNYANTATNNNPVKIWLPQDAVTKRLLMAQTVEDYSILNPIVEVEKSRAITPKGHSGMNLDSAYTLDKRSYDPTMMGILAVSTSPDANTGIVRQLSLEPNMINARGYIEVKNDKLDELKDVNLFSPAEMLSPLGVTRDDTVRTAMATKQSKHIIPIEKASPVLISNGAEQTLPYHLSNDFTIVAKEDGKVIEIDEKTQLAIVQYKSGSKQAIELEPRIVKNGAGGFYLANKLELNVKLNQTFKARDIIARDPKFFNHTQSNGTRFNIGALEKVAVMGGYASYEDSTFVTQKMSEDMAADIIMQRPVTLGKNATVDFIVNVGDKVKVGDELIRFETSFEDENLNSFLNSIGDELKEDIQSLGKTPIKSKYSGTVEAIKMYSTVELDELSPSLRRLVGKHYAGIIQKKKLLDKHDKSDGTYKLGVLLNEPSTKVEAKNGKLKGAEVGEGVLIEFYIKYRDTLGVGDKIAFFTALKSIIGEVIPEGYEPYSMYRPDEEVSSIIAPGAILARMTPSILQTLWGNKVLVELKHQLKDIFDGK